MNNTNRAVIFDVDGTLLNPEEGVCAAVNYVINTYCLPPISHEDILAFNGPPIQTSFLKHYSLNEEQIQELTEAFRKRYKEHDLYLAQIYTGIYDLMNYIKNDGIKIGIATYKRQDYARDLMNHFNFDNYAASICGADNFNLLKKADIIKNCMETLSVLPENVVMVGDSDNDAIASETLGIGFIGVTYGFGFKKAAEIAPFKKLGYAESPEEIYTILKKWYGGKKR